MRPVDRGVRKPYRVATSLTFRPAVGPASYEGQARANAGSASVPSLQNRRRSPKTRSIALRASGHGYGAAVGSSI